MTRSDSNSPATSFLAGGGEMGERMRAKDWSATPLGPPDTWPQSLRSTISMLLPSKAQIILFWGPGFTVFYNDAYRPVFGAKHPRALGLPGAEAWSEIWDSVLHQLLAGVVRTGEAFWAKDLLFKLERYGFVEETYFDVSYDPVRVESGDVGGVFCIVTETTERVIGERRMALLKDLAARNATARTPREACTLATETLAARPDVTFALTYLDGELQSGTPGAEEALARTPSDLVRFLAVSSGAGARTGRLAVGLNPERPFDDHYRGFLELVADQLSTALSNARAYEEERKRAEALAEIDRAKTAFFSNVSHEFRTPLTLLLGPVQDALTHQDRSLSGDALASVNRNALRLLKLVNTLLDFARIEAGRAQATYEATDLAAFTTDLAGAFRSAIESAGLQFDVACDPIDELVHVDRSMWEKIVFNLLSNALKFTFEGRIGLHLARAEHSVLLTVSDTGVGIPADELPQLFQRFHRVRTARARTHEGTGIGLALVQELVRHHGGAIEVESSDGEGATFRVTIPLGTGHLASESMAAPRSLLSTSVSADAYVDEALGWLGQSDAPRQPTAGDGRPARILLADDNADMRDYVGRLLGERWDVEAAGDGAAALAAARRQSPDAVVADVMMPELDGFGLLAALRADAATQNIPVILVSARAGEEATLKGIGAGADDYLVKPFTARDLLARVDAQVTRARAREAVRDRMTLVESLLSNLPLGVYLVDQDFRIAYVNPVAAPTFGDIPDLVGNDFDSVIHRLWTKDYADEIVRIFRRTLATGEPHVTAERAELRLDRAVVEYYEWRVVRLTFPDGRFGVVCYFRDISAQVHARNELAEANRAKDEFLATLSHELRTPLNAVLGWAQMLRTGTLRPDARERALQSLERNARAQAQLVDDLLDVSRIVSGKLAIAKEPLDFTAVIASAVDAIRPAAEAKGLQLHVGIDAGGGMVVDGDPGRLQQVVSNLLSNAVKFTPAGGTIDVDLRPADGAIELVVRDSGDGIDPAFLPHVFDRFRQGDSTTSRTHGGLGLGLAIVRHLTEAHGGTVSAHSDGSGTGAMFIVRLPCVERKPPRPSAKAAGAAAHAGPPS
jgi:PAS domain S-box-containing protein